MKTTTTTTVKNITVKGIKTTPETVNLDKLREQARKGIVCLQKLKVNQDVLESKTKIYVTFGLVKMNEKQRLKPVKIQLSNSIHENETVCMIVKDPQSEWKEKLGGLGVDKVIGISKLRAKYKPYEAKRQLCATYDLFLSDDRVIELLPKMLGKSFFKAKKQPVPVDLKSGKFKKEIDLALGSTSLVFNLGTCCSVKAGFAEMSQDELVQNVMDCIEGVVAKIPGKWTNIRCINIKSCESTALPIYNALPVVDSTDNE